MWEEKKSWYCSNPEYDSMEEKINDTLFAISERERYIENINISLDSDNYF
ncbi:hypothetical protein [Clostridium sp. ZBS15]|nr:hypothetical protein [Clostridium sp. ZBS15]